jgi:excisionase family DNA binding protein
VYSVRQVAALLGMNLGLVYELVRKGEIPAKRLGKRWIIPRRAFGVWLNTPSAESGYRK